MKKLTSIVVLVVFVMMFSLSFSAVALEEDEALVSGDFEYYVCPENAHEDYRGTVVITGYLGNDSDVVIPAEIDGKKVSVIGDYLFYKNENLKSVKLPDNVISIGTEAFSLCKSLETVNIPSGVKEIGGAFRGCEKLIEVTIPEGIEYLYFDIFKDCTSLKNVKLPNSLKTIYDHAFENCTSLSEIAIPDSVVEIGSGVFAGCTSLGEISIPESVSYMGNGVFTAAAVYNDSTNWVDGALYISGCLVDSKREEINGEYSVEDGTRIIAENAFFGTKGLEALKLPKGIKSVCASAFADCSSLKTVELPVGLEMIGDGAFMKCGMESMVIPEGVKSIGNNAFENCKLKRITFSKSLEIIGNGAFDRNSIYTVQYNGTEKDWNDKQLGKSLILNPYATLMFGEKDGTSDAVSNTSEESIILSQTESENETSETENNGEGRLGAWLWVIIGIVAAVILIVVSGIAVMRTKGKK